MLANLSLELSLKLNQAKLEVSTAIPYYDTSLLCHNMAVSLLVTPHTTLIERFWLKYFPCFCPNYYIIG